MIQVIVSACILGENVRYNGKARPCSDPVLLEWIEQGRILSFCPEISGGLDVPRSPVELINGDGFDVLNGSARCMGKDGQDYTAAFIRGTYRALKMIGNKKVGLAIIKDGSPSCGKTYIYDGTFSGRKIEGKGVFAAGLERNGIPLFTEKETAWAAQWLKIRTE